MPAKPERRLTKVRRKLSTKRAKSSGRLEKESESQVGSPQQLPTPLLTTWDDLRSSSTTRLQLREHFSSTFPESDLSLNEPALQSSTAHRRPSTSSFTSHRSEVEEPQQTIDVPAAIALLQELKKHASPDELVALHKALLPVRRSVDASSIGSPHDLETSTVLESRYNHPHRRSSRYFPGLATRGNDPLQTIEELEVKRRSFRDEKKRRSLSMDALQTMKTSGGLLAISRPMALVRTASTGSNDNPNIGWYPAGTLRITNRSPSPNLREQVNVLEDAIEMPLQAVQPSLSNASEPVTTSDYAPLAPVTFKPLQLKTWKSASGLREMADDKVDSGMNLTKLQDEILLPLRYTLSETDLTRPQRLNRSASKASLTAAMEEYAQFSGSPYDRTSMSHVQEEPKTPSASSFDSFKTSVEAQRQPRERPIEHQTLPAHLLENLAKLEAPKRPIPPQQGDSGYASEESNGRQSHSLDNPQRDEYSGRPSYSMDDQRREQDYSATMRPITPKSPHSSTRTLRSRTTEEAYLPSSIDALPVAAHAFQRIEDLFVAPGASQPPSRRQTLLSTFGLGRKSSESSRSTSELTRSDSTASKLGRTISGSGKKSKGPNKLQKTSSRKSAKARKALAKFDPVIEETPQVIRSISPVEDDTPYDIQLDWHHEQYDNYQPPYQPPRLGPQPSARDKWQPYHYDRRPRNLSVVQEVDHDSLMDRDDKFLQESGRSSRRSELQYSECGEIPIGVTLLHPVNSNISDRPLSMERLHRASTQSTHRMNHSVSSMSTLASGQLDLIEEVQNATIDWAVQAKFWRARRTLVGQGLQPDGDDQENDEHAADNQDEGHDSHSHSDYRDEEDQHYQQEQQDEDHSEEVHQYQQDEYHDAAQHYRQHDHAENGRSHEYDNVAEATQHLDSAEVAEVQPARGQSHMHHCISSPPRSYIDEFATKYRDIRRVSSTSSSMSSRPRNTFIDTVLGPSVQLVDDRVSVADMLGRRHIGSPGQSPVTSQHEWNRDTSLTGSNGLHDSLTSVSTRSTPSRLRYGVDLSDVPVFASTASPDRMRSASSFV